MADINFGILDTQSPAKIGNAFIRSPEQQNANMLQAMQMQGFVNQNELAQSQLRTARRAEEGQALLGQAYAGTDFGTGRTAGGIAGGAGQSPYPSMRESIVKKLIGTPGAYLIPGELAKITKMEHDETINREAQGKVERQAREAIDYTLKQYQTEVPRVTDAAGVERYVRATFRDKLLGPIVSRFKTEDQAVADSLNLFNSPGGPNKWATQNMGMSADKLVDMLKTTTRTTNLGNVSREVKEDFFGNLVGSAVDTPMGISPNTAATIKAARINHLENLAQQGWTFDTERGIGVNARLGLSKPISTLMSQTGGPLAAPVGGAPAVQSGVPMVAPTGVPTGVPGQRQAPAGQPVAGPSVLGPKPEQPIFNAEAQGFIYKPSSDNPQGKFVPVQGMDGKPLNEVQAKSALFGSAMQQSNTVIKDLEAKGTVKSAVVPGLITGIVKLAPLGVGDAAANAVESMFRADPTGLVGPDVNQQRLAQAQLGFAIGYLRATSGAAFGPQEVANTIQEYFPLQGEGQQVINQKSAARERAIQGMKISAGKSGSAFIDSYAPKASAGNPPANLSLPPPGAVRPRGSR